jgi:aminocarboxymuconate-semialdehyde decarboxylase
VRTDVHAHYYPSALIDGFHELGGPLMEARHPADLGERLPVLDGAGIDRQVLSSGALMPYFADTANARQGARLFNQLYAEAIAPCRQRFGAFGALPLPHLAESVAETDYCLDELGFSGIAIGSGAGDLPIDDDYFAPLWRKLDERHAVVYIHPGVNNGSVLGGVDYQPWLLNPSFGSPGETGRCLARLVLAGLPKRYPGVTIIAANSGGLLPLTWSHLIRAAEITGHPELAEGLRGLWFDCGTTTDYWLMAVKSSFGLDRLVFGTDCPYGNAAATVGLIRNSPLLKPEEAGRILDSMPIPALR